MIQLNILFHSFFPDLNQLFLQGRIVDIMTMVEEVDEAEAGVIVVKFFFLSHYFLVAEELFLYLICLAVLTFHLLLFIYATYLFVFYGCQDRFILYLFAIAERVFYICMACASNYLTEIP